MARTRTPTSTTDGSPPPAPPAANVEQRAANARLILDSAASLHRQMHAWSNDYYELEVEKQTKGARFQRYLMSQWADATILADLRAEAIEPLGEECARLIGTVQHLRDEVLPVVLDQLRAHCDGAAAGRQHALFREAEARLSDDILAFREYVARLGTRQEFGG